MNVLFVSTESCPFAKTGGLGEIIGTLPKALQGEGVNTRVVIPNFATIAPKHKEKMADKAEYCVSVGWRNQPCVLKELEHEEVLYYFVDNDYYFGRERLYGYYDDAERFAFFCRAVLQAIPYMDFVPDIIHCHDWPTGLISVFLDAHFKKQELYSQIKTVFSIHNLKYKGVFPKEILGDLLHLNWDYFTMNGLEYYDQVSYIKGGIIYSDMLSTVSRTYAEEIQTAYFGEGMDGLLRYRKDKLVGIINGICYDKYDPLTDPNIFVNYRSSMTKKQENKIKLQELLQLPVDKDIPMIGLVSRLVEQKGLDLVIRVLDEIMALQVQVVVLGTGDPRFEGMFREAARRYPEKLSANIFYEDQLERKIMAASDIFLMPSQFEPCGISQMIAMRYGSVPVVRETGGLKDTVEPYNEYTGTGNGFSFTNYNAHDMLYTIERAVRFYQDKGVWNLILENIERCNFSWRRSASEYINLYKNTLQN